VALLDRRSRIRPVDTRPGNEEEGIDAFVSEEALAAGVRIPTPESTVPAAADAKPSGLGGVIKWVAVVTVSAGTAAGAMWAYQRAPGQPQPSSLTLQTTPSGAQVTIGGKAMGATPLTVSLPAGEYPIELSTPDGRQRAFAVTLTAGGTVVQHVEMPAPVNAAAASGALVIETTPAKQAVLVDGIERGFSPLTVRSLTPGEHVVVVRTPNGNVRRTIAVEQGETVSLVISGPETTALRAGWVTFASPIPLELREGGRLVGTTATERLMLPAGDHEIEMSNESLGFRVTRRVTVAPDRSASIPVDVPNGTISINALPWAEVWVGGERIGETPIANLTRPIGTHEVLLRHPQFGERKARLTVSLKQPARLGVDMRTP
jgi:hypothetical protein